MDAIDPTAGEAATKAALKAIDDTLYALMRVVDGEAGQLCNERYGVELHAVVKLVTNDEPRVVVHELDANDEGDGWCMGIHGWLSGDFGERPPIEGELSRQPPSAL